MTVVVPLKSVTIGQAELHGVGRRGAGEVTRSSDKAAVEEARKFSVAILEDNVKVVVSGLMLVSNGRGKRGFLVDVGVCEGMVTKNSGEETVAGLVADLLTSRDNPGRAEEDDAIGCKGCTEETTVDEHEEDTLDETVETGFLELKTSTPGSI